MQQNGIKVGLDARGAIDVDGGGSSRVADLSAAKDDAVATDEAVGERELHRYHVGDVVDIAWQDPHVDTENGLEIGAIVVGKAKSGDPTEMRVKLVDGDVHDWPVVDFCNVRTQEEDDRRRKAAALENKAAALKMRVAPQRKAAALETLEVAQRMISSYPWMEKKG